MRVTAVGFDLDDTLAVTDRPRATLLSDATEAVSAPSLSRDDYLDAHSRHLATETREPIFADLLPEESKISSETLTEAYRNAILDALTPLTGIPNMLDTLRQNYRVGLLTNGPVVAQRGKIAQLGWEPYFDTTIVTGELDAGKPDSRAFDALCSELESSPEETVYVGDNPKMDVLGANDAGMMTVQVLYPGGPEAEPAADAHIDRDELVLGLPDLLSSL
ncbi:putative hydrolase of the HAD superfamily [Haladaptatus litoreus]|uniref:Putative hydrolase of the HAD superfamily n=1 Tax=Haladaptatus litoreus TaxID=553468 RepID=A0A1N6ZQR7_9EURY|nr:HAD family hydrolase [Haladaptatus litoreus]SIR29233.1 putative hydrolase of the HAD superfamily [Haladaptatus litoreus]